MMDWEEGEVVRRQGVFCTALVRQFMKKICKYQNLMLRHNVNITDSGYGSSVHTSRSFDDDIELVLRENSSAVDSCKSFWNLGARLSVLRLFQWVSKIVQRTKAARILCHIDAIPDSEIESTIIEVARELSVAFEYQILMLYGDSEVIKLADHAISCLTTYLNSCDSAFTCSNLLQAILEVKPLTGNKKDVVRTKVVTFSGNSVCLHWKLWQIFKQPGLRVPADSPEIKLEEKTTVGSDTACSTQTGNVGTNNLKCAVTDEEPSVCLVSDETKTKNAQLELDESTRCDNIEKLRDEENEQSCPGTVFGKSIRDFEQEINGDIISVEEERLDSLSESYSSEEAIAQDIYDNKNTATSEDISDSTQDTQENENILSRETGDKLILQNKVTENILTTNEKIHDIQPTNDIEHVFATDDTLDIFNETDSCDENVLEEAVPLATDEVCNSSEEIACNIKERVGMEDDLSNMETFESLQERLPTHDAVVIEDNQGSVQGTKTEDDKVVVESQEITRDKELDFIKGQDITKVFETSENGQSLERSSDCESDSEYSKAVHPAASFGPANELDVNYDRYNDCSQSIDTDSNIFPVTVQAGGKVKNIVYDVIDKSSYYSDTLTCINDNSKYIIQGENEDSVIINNRVLEDAIPGTSVVYEHDTQRASISENLSNQERVTQVIKEIKEDVLVSENLNSSSPSRPVSKQDTQTNYIPESQLDQVIVDHAIEEIEQNVPLPERVISNSSAVSEHDTEMNISESQLNPVVTALAIEDIEQNNAYRFYGCFTPYGAKCRPNIYGFRGPLHIWNEDEGKYTLVYNDRVTVANSRARQIPLTEGDIHQAYIPKSFCKH